MSSTTLVDSNKGEYEFLKDLGIKTVNPGVFNGHQWTGNGQTIESICPANGQVIASIVTGSLTDYNQAVDESVKAWHQWVELPAPKRGEIVRQIGNALREKKKQLGQLISLEMGKILSEGEGEVQEYIDICDYAVGLSRMLNGQVMPSERPDHVLMENWNPLGTVGIISAFNFPMAVFGWNNAIALVCGNTMVWKPAPTTSLCGIAITKLLESIFVQNGLPSSVCTLVTGGASIGQAMADDRRLPLLSFTGSTEVGRKVGESVQRRFGKHILELGGNNAIVVCADADLDMAIRASVFACAGTAGQRCTTTRRLIVHRSVHDEIVQRLASAYGQLRIGDPLNSNTLYGPLHTDSAIASYLATIERAQQSGGRVVCGGHKLDRPGYFVEPTIITGLAHDSPVVHQETFAPIVYVIPFDQVDEAIAWNNEVEQGLSSSIFTQSLENVFKVSSH